MSKIMEWVDARLPVSDLIKSQATEYPTPKNLNYWWNFGSLALTVLLIMILTGLFLAMHYKPDAGLAFDSVEHIMRDVNYGWLLRYMHANGASFFFIVIYIHILRGMYYGSYKAPREILWWIGIIIFFMMMGTAFMGYVLPWGQMSYWGAAVITNLMSAIPLVGPDLVTWIWGGFSVGDPTLNRFFVLHFLLPFVLFGVVFVHLWALHAVHSNNPVGIDVPKKDTIPFHPYYTIKDVFGVGVLLIVYLSFVFYAPRSFRYRPLSKQLFWIFFIDTLILGWVGYNPADATVLNGALPMTTIGRVATFVYFGYFVLLWAITAFGIEKPKSVPQSI